MLLHCAQPVLEQCTPFSGRAILGRELFVVHYRNNFTCNALRETRKLLELTIAEFGHFNAPLC